MNEIVQNLAHRRGLRQSRTSYLQEGIVGLIDLIQGWVERHRTRGDLYRMPDYMLRDIGVSRVDVEQEWSKPFWKS